MTTRRDFIQRASALAVLPLIPAISLESLAAAKVPLDDPAAKALRYVEDATLAKRADKMGVAAAEQVCSNCRFYITANADELELITNGIVSPSSIRLFTHFLHHVCIEVRVTVFREEQVQLPERHETVEDVWVLEIGDLWLRLNDRFSCFGIIVLAGEAACITHFSASVHRKDVTTYFSHSAPSDLRS